MKLNNKSLLLYAVTDRRWSNNDTFYKHIEESLEGGVTFLQLREKNLDTDSFFKEAIKIKEEKGYDLEIVEVKTLKDAIDYLEGL